MFAIGGQLGLGPSSFEGREGHDLGVQTVGIGRLKRSAAVVEAAVEMGRDEGVDQFRVQQRAIARHAHDIGGVERHRGLVIAVEHIVERAAEAIDRQMPAIFRDRIVARIRAGGDDQSIEPAGPSKPFDLIVEHWPPKDRFQHLTGQTRRRHPGLKDGHDHAALRLRTA